jgi:Icc-related predicted phosphoesterase
MRIVCFSDTHGMSYTWPESIPDGDVLVCAGDFTNNGELRDVGIFAEITKQFNHPNKILIAGNHDWCCERERQVVEDMLPGWTYLQDRAVVIDGVKFYGSPWQPYFCNWAFNVRSIEKRRLIWSQIPEDTDVLITHCPPHKTLDAVNERVYQNWMEQDLIVHTGCVGLQERLTDLKVKLHLFGHIHEAYGVRKTDFGFAANCSICDLNYNLRNRPLVFELVGDEIFEIL